MGGQLDLGTGLSRPAITGSLKNLVKAELVLVRKNFRGNRYMLNPQVDVDKVVNQLNQLRKLTRSSKRNLPKVGNVVNPQNSGNKGKQSLRENSGEPGDNLREKIGELASQMTINKFNHY